MKRVNSNNILGLSLSQQFIKRSFDIALSTLGLLLVWWIILISFILASINTRSNGFFVQTRVGRNGKQFKVIKIKTMRQIKDVNTTITTNKDPRITSLGAFFRRTKIDELPQLINVCLGHMSFVGPRPDVPGYADKLKGDDRIILSIRPGITGPATIKYKNEEKILANESDPEMYNNNIIFPDKVLINKQYIYNYSLMNDLKYLYATLFGTRKFQEKTIDRESFNISL